MALHASARRVTAACGLAVFFFACNAFDDDSGDVGGSFHPGTRVDIGVGGALSPGLGSRSGGTGGAAGVGGAGVGLDAAVATPPTDAATAPLLPGCAPTSPGCGGMIAHPVETEQPCVLALGDLRVDSTLFCHGLVTLGATRLACGNPDGWTVTADGTLLVLLGEACRVYTSTHPSLSVVFPCDTACRLDTSHAPDAAVGAGEDAGVD